jgi:LPXTG-motif cell wall-anchored protein
MRAILTSVTTLPLFSSLALAQTPPVQGAPANTPDNTGDIGSTWWLIAIAVLAVLVVWYFARNRNRT